MQRVRRIDGSAVRGGKYCQRERFVIGPKESLGGYQANLRNRFLEEAIFEIWFLISQPSICQFPALTIAPGTGQNGITEK
ncbi:hypothetical protein FJW07_23665 [Mesorhizobium sp. B3-1-9]|uniref:hypothetical protein n=1 Tax=Mesorhizobium sp. B3-1-9 TaxID=2589892 RepID=UPI001128DE6D|nr:hypothetical protein [Mesorhizobium sp. B3-1-9]TPI35461.1 hypothetical protein FJW07_23665 [Mesorhizobium sp. B3-1-9]